MATKTNSQDLANLVINRVESQTAFQQMVASGQVNANELYLVEGDETVTYTISKSGGTITLTGSDGSTSAVTVPTATSDLTNDSGFITSSSLPSASTSTPAMDGTGAAGSSSVYARGDHVHPTDTSRAPTSHASSSTTYGTGTSSNYGHLKLSASTTSTLGTSGGTAATPSAVKAVKDAIPTATSDLTNDSGFITDAGVTSFNGDTGAITYTAPVTSVNGSTGAVTISVPTVTSDLTNDSGFITSASVPSASTTTPNMDGTASYGSGTTWARADHVHPTDTSRAPTSHASSATTYGTGTSSNYGHVKLSDSTSSASGVSGGVAATPAAVKSVMDSIPTVPTATTTTPKMDGTAAVGSETQWAKGDHVHPTDTSRAPTSHASSATTYGTGTSSNYGHLKLSDSTSSTSSTSGGTAATPAAVKAAYDLANGKQDPITVATTVESGNANPVSSGAVYTALQSAGKQYSTTFTTSSWSSQAITVNASTHGCGTAPMVQVQKLNGSSYETYYGFPSTGWKVSIDTSGNVTLSVPASGDEFSGRLVIR